MHTDRHTNKHHTHTHMNTSACDHTLVDEEASRTRCDAQVPVVRKHDVIVGEIALQPAVGGHGIEG